MALIKCKECGKEISSNATACPQCGAKPPVKTSALTWIVGAITLVVVYQCSSSGNNSLTGSKPPAAPKTEAEKKEDAELNVAIAVGKVIKKNTKDPSSFKVDSFVYFPGRDACYEYRGKNSFGAIVPGKAVFAGGKVLTRDNDGNKFVKSWNSVCTQGGGKERAGGLNLLGVW